MFSKRAFKLDAPADATTHTTFKNKPHTAEMLQLGSSVFHAHGTFATVFLYAVPTTAGWSP